jgi:FtsH-binding integral membrane protein
MQPYITRINYSLRRKIMDYRNQNPMSYSTRGEAVSYDAGLRSYMLGVYNYMASAVALTGITAFLASHYAPLMAALYNFDGVHAGLTGLGWIVMFAPLLFVFGLSMGINRLSLPAAQCVFWGYAAVMGLSLSSIFFVYTGASLARVFFITAILFGSMSMWGYATKRDLTSMGHFMIMGVWGIIIASLVNMFMQSNGLQFLISIVGVIAFTGLTAYDTQQIKSLYYQTSGDSTAAGKSAILGALSLYLDFVNMFMMLLRLFGDRK